MLQLLNQYRIRLIELLLCVAIPVGLYYPALGFPAFSDDFSFLASVKNGLSHNWFSIRYVGGISVLLENYFFGDSFFVNHLFSLIYHGITGFLALITSRIIFINIFRFTPSRAISAAYLVACLFLLYPFHLEAVFWLSGRGVILAALFALLATYFFLKAESIDSSKGILCVCCYILSLSSYESALLLPFAWVSLIIVGKRKIVFRSILPILFLPILYPLLSLSFSRSGLVYKYLRADIDILSVLKNVSSLFARLFTPPADNTTLFIGLALVVLATHIYLLRMQFASQNSIRRSVFAIVPLMVSIAPFITIGIDTHDFESGRYLYFAAPIYLILLVGGLIQHLSRGIALGVGLIIAIYFISFGRVVLSTWSRSASVVINALLSLPINKHADLVIGNVPDSYKGAYIFRNGLWSAFDLYENKTLGYERRFAFTKVDWDEFVRFENRFKTFTEQERSTYVDELRRLYRTKYPETPDSAITVYLFTSDGMLKLDNADGRFGD